MQHEYAVYELITKLINVIWTNATLKSWALPFILMFGILRFILWIKGITSRGSAESLRDGLDETAGEIGNYMHYGRQYRGLRRSGASSEELRRERRNARRWVWLAPLAVSLALAGPAVRPALAQTETPTPTASPTTTETPSPTATITPIASVAPLAAGDVMEAVEIQAAQLGDTFDLEGSHGNAWLALGFWALLMGLLAWVRSWVRSE
jgi:hypothetical protein